jgi:hypothetical protein
MTFMALASCILGKLLGVVAIVFPCLKTFPLSPTDASTAPTTRALLVDKCATVGENGVR